MARKIKTKKKIKQSIWRSGKKINWKIFIACLVIVFSVAFIGSTFTDTGVWYESVKPSITPPNWVFPVVWTILFYFITIALYYTVTSSKGKYQVRIGLLFGINFLLNILWSFFYFTSHNPFYAFVDIILLLLSIVSLILVGWKIDRRASIILIPYLLWVCFATLLNYLTILNVK
ncbi:TspO/MBR family protein [uncultured archaeon]|nr:TspO/MBR family protein [uncultured archaeon]